MAIKIIGIPENRNKRWAKNFGVTQKLIKKLIRQFPNSYEFNVAINKYLKERSE